MNEDDVISIGKLRRKNRPGANVSYDPGYGIRIEGEDVPREPSKAAAWIRRQRGFLRIYFSAFRVEHIGVKDFLKAWHACGV